MTEQNKSNVTIYVEDYTVTFVAKDDGVLVKLHKDDEFVASDMVNYGEADDLFRLKSLQSIMRQSIATR